MIKAKRWVFLFPPLLGLIGCSGLPKSRPNLLDDANRSLQEGTLAYAQSNWHRASRLFERALNDYRSVDDQEGELYSRINLAETALATNNYPACKTQLDRSAEIIRHLALRTYQPRIDLMNAQLALQQKDYPIATWRLQTLLPETYDTTATTIQLSALASRTQIAFIQNHDAELWLRRFEQALQRSGNTSPELNARLLRFQAYRAQREDDIHNADLKLQEALVSYKTALFRPGIAATLMDLGDLHSAKGDTQTARNFFERALSVYEYLGNHEKTTEIQKKLHPKIRD